MTRNELMVVEEYERLRSQIETLENDEKFPNRKSQIVMSDEDCCIAQCDTFKTVYHFGASLKDLGKKWFASRRWIENAHVLRRQRKNAQKHKNFVHTPVKMHRCCAGNQWARG